jgi:hypothetical protein
MGRAMLAPPPGAGDIVIRELTPSDAAGIRRFTMTVARGNRGALALARELGECTVVGADGPAMDLRVDL